MTKPFHFQWKALTAEEGVDAGGAAGLFSRVISAVRMMWCTGGPQHQASRTGQNLEAGVIFKGPFNVAPTTRH